MESTSLVEPCANKSFSLWNKLQGEIVNCKKCPRLARFREKVAFEKKRQFKDFDYWGKPVPSLGLPSARLVIIGLAPAAHGGNRTGRMFTGDGSARFLFKHLHEAGFASQPNSDHRGDGLEIVDCYITAVAHCVPPDNKLERSEIENCSLYLEREFREILENPKVVLALGKVAFDSFIDFARKKKFPKEEEEVIRKREARPQFKHGKRYSLGEGVPVVYASYHPSPRNTQTGKLSSRMFSRVLRDVKKEIDS